MQWCNLLDNISSYVPSNLIEVGFVDDGKSTLKGSVMHMGRVPWPNYDINILKCNELKLLHYQLTNMERQRSKSLWYRAYEKVGKGEFGPIIYRKYSERNHRINAQKTKEEWLYGYQKLGIDVTSVAFGYDYSHDYRLLDYLDEYGASYFRMVNIWSKDWVQFAQGKKVNPERFKDPRNRLDRLIFKYMDWSVHTNKNVIKRFSIRLVDAILKLIRYSS
jgi:hypothetical protein